MQYLHLTCSREHLYDLVDTLKEQFVGHEAACLLDYGISSKLIQAYIVLRCQDEIDEGLINQLLADKGILDLSIFTDSCRNNDLFSPLSYV